MSELIKRLKINQVNQMIVALALVESCREDVQHEGNIPSINFHIAIKILKQKLLEYYQSSKPEPLPEHITHKALYLLSTHPEMVNNLNIIEN